MLTVAELVRALLVPAVIAGLIAALGRWRGWNWMPPVAVGAGFLAGYAAFGVPTLPPRDGTDWLFWLAIPLTLLGVVDATVLRERRWGWAVGGVAAGLVPLVPHQPGRAEQAVELGGVLRVEGEGKDEGPVGLALAPEV